MTVINRMYNAGNPYQGKAKRVLCVCSAGLLRSPTLANVLHKEFGYNTRAVGADKEFALIPAEQVHIEWADEIVCVHNLVHESLKHVVNLDGARVVILDLPDQYAYMDKELQRLCVTQYQDAGTMEKARR